MQWFRYLLISTITAGFLLCSCSEKADNIFSVNIVDPLDGGADIEMASIPAGLFMMGSNLYPATQVDTFEGRITIRYNRERPVHAVTIGAFKIGTTEVTQEQYRAVMETNPSKFTGEMNMPVDRVSWQDAITFCNKLSEKTGIEPCYDLETGVCDYTRDGFRLPTEAEWEYAARAGSTTEYNSGSDANALATAGWYTDNTWRRTSPVGAKMSNAAGLYDMHGNVAEWCNDFFGRYHCNSEENPEGPSIGYYRVVRGGSWASVAKDCRSASRRSSHPGYLNYTIGFRVVRR